MSPNPMSTREIATDLITPLGAYLRLRDGALDVLADHRRRLPAADPFGWAVRVACGAAVLNARLAFAVAGCPAQVRVRPDPERHETYSRLYALYQRLYQSAGDAFSEIAALQAELTR